MTTNTYVRIALNLALVVFALLLLANGQPLSPTFRFASMAASVVPIGLLIFENFLWKLPLLQSLSFFPVPNLTGTWEGKLLSNYPNPDGSQRAPIETYIVIRQTFFWISMRQYTVESESVLVSGSINTERDGVRRLVGVYRNDPRFDVRSRSAIHYGAFTYSVEGHPVSCIDGHYWTDRMSGGSARFARHSSATEESFVAARSRFLESLEPHEVPVA